MYILIWCFPNVHHHVDYELIILSESLVTLDRLKRSFSRVFLLMVYGRCLSWKSLVTMVTLIRFIYWMSLWVSFQMNFLKEILITLITLILPLSCVFSHMNFYLNIINESLIALTTMKCFFLQCVSSYGLAVYYHQKKPCHIDYTDILFFPWYVSLNYSHLVCEVYNTVRIVIWIRL